LGKSLSECAAKYRGFCKRYKPQPKPDKSYHWGSKLLPKVVKHKGKKTSPGQMRLPWVEWEFEDSPVREVAEQFVVANCYEPKIAMRLFDESARYRNY
jgi:putative transposase